MKKIRIWLGNIFIVTSLSIIIFIYLPVISLYLFPPPENKLSNNLFSIEIPKIKLYSPIVPNIDPYNKKVYKEALKKGIAHAKGTAFPGEKKTVYLFGHSSDAPWNLTRYNPVFLKLGELNRGDLIILRKDKKEYHYKVVDKKTVWPSDVKYLRDISKNQLILQTCTPIGTDFQRLLIFANPV